MSSQTTNCPVDGAVLNVPSDIGDAFREHDKNIKQALISFQNKLKRLEGENLSELSYGKCELYRDTYDATYGYVQNFFCNQLDPNSNITIIHQTNLSNMIEQTIAFYDSYNYERMLKSVNHQIPHKQMRDELVPAFEDVGRRVREFLNWAVPEVAKLKARNNSAQVNALTSQVNQNTQQIATNSSDIVELKIQVGHLAQNAKRIEKLEQIIGEIREDAKEDEILPLIEANQDAISIVKDIISVTADLSIIKPYANLIKDVEKVFTIGNLLATLAKRLAK